LHSAKPLWSFWCVISRWYPSIWQWLSPAFTRVRARTGLLSFCILRT
jgi:hypothetical protein